jgi:hypothetical protein
MSMIARLPPNALESRTTSQTPRIVNASPLPPCRAQAAADAQMVLTGELVRDDERVGLRQEDGRIVDHRLVAALGVMLAQAAVARHVDAEDQDAPFAHDPGIDDRLDNRHRDADRQRRLHLLETSSSKPVSPPSPAARSCRQSDPTVRKTQTARSGSPCACRRGSRANDARRRQQRAQHVPAKVGPADQPQKDHGGG